MNDDLRDRLDAVEQAVDGDRATVGVTVVLDGDYVDAPDDLPPGFVVSSEYDADAGADR
jgi:hypothetical protein